MASSPCTDVIQNIAHLKRAAVPRYTASLNRAVISEYLVRVLWWRHHIVMSLVCRYNLWLDRVFGHDSISWLSHFESRAHAWRHLQQNTFTIIVLIFDQRILSRWKERRGHDESSWYGQPPATNPRHSQPQDDAWRQLLSDTVLSHSFDVVTLFLFLLLVDPHSCYCVGRSDIL